MRIIAMILLVCGMAISGIAQVTPAMPPSDIPDTVLLNDGKVIISHITDTVGYSIEMMRPHSRRHKKLEIEKESIFQITFGNTGKCEVIYYYDTLIGNDFTVEEARRFISGEQDARKGYHAIATSAIAFAIGVGSGTAVSYFAFGGPFVFMGFMSYRHVKINHHSVKDINNVHHDSYLYGYAFVARQKRVSKAMLWGGIGVAVGSVLHYILANNQ